jgi:hypothetical protein
MKKTLILLIYTASLTTLAAQVNTEDYQFRDTVFATEYYSYIQNDSLRAVLEKIEHVKWQLVEVKYKGDIQHDDFETDTSAIRTFFSYQLRKDGLIMVESNFSRMTRDLYEVGFSIIYDANFTSRFYYINGVIILKEVHDGFIEFIKNVGTEYLYVVRLYPDFKNRIVFKFKRFSF